MSKTPKFDSAIEEILKNLVPHARVCGMCNREFQVEQGDIEFYNMLRVPPPKLCVECRLRIRRAFVNYATFYRKKCDVPGHTETLISQIPEGAPFPVYDFTYYWNGDWDPFSFGKGYDDSRPFFAQFRELMEKVPQPANTGDTMSVASEYAAYGAELKNCYYIFGGLKAENVLYGNWPMHSRDSMEILVAMNSNKCYEIVQIEDCYRCKFSYFSKACLDSLFMFDCRNCEHCFGCVNLRNKKYHFFNKPLTKKEYEEKMKSINLGKRSELKMWKKKFFELLVELPKRIAFNEKSISSKGNLLINCKDAYGCFYVLGGEHLRYTELEMGAKDSMDLLLGTSPQKSYYSVSPYDGFEIKFSSMTRGECRNIEYSINMKTCENCFACIGLENKKFCIFNTQYSEEEYWKCVDKIKTEMLAEGEYGEFFPMNFSPFPYDGSISELSFSVTKEEAEKEGLWYYEKEESEFEGEILEGENIPDDISDVGEEILKKAIKCRKTGRLFRITKNELDFYKSETLPIPDVHPETRLKERFAWINNLNLETMKCTECGKPITGTPYKPAGDTIICDDCFQNRVF